MDIRIVEEQGRAAMEVTIRCAPADPRASRVAQRLRAMSGRVTGYASPGSPERLVIAADELLYIDSVGRRTYLHTKDGETLESPLRLFELEESLADSELVRASRQAIVNLDRVRSIRPEPGGRLVLTLDDGTPVLATRSHARDIKALIGITR